MDGVQIKIASELWGKKRPLSFDTLADWGNRAQRVFTNKLFEL